MKRQGGLAWLYTASTLLRDSECYSGADGAASVVRKLLNLGDAEILHMLKNLEKANSVAIVLPTTGQGLTSESDFLLRSRRLLECELLEKEIEKDELEELKAVDKKETEELAKALRAAGGCYIKRRPPSWETHIALPVDSGKEALLGLARREHPLIPLEHLLP